MRSYLFGFLALFFVETAQGETLAFPTADGYGRIASGGRGGKVCKVKSLKQSGPGTLLHCLENLNNQPTTIVFDVAGAIQWDDAEHKIQNCSNLTIAGQSAPGKIYLRNGMIYLRDCKNVIIRYFSVRWGDQPKYRSTQSGFRISRVDHAIMDHVSAAWVFDDGITCSGKNCTIQNSIFAQGLWDNGSIFGKCSINANNSFGHSYLRNLCIDAYDRYPLAQSREMGIFNNYIVANQGSPQAQPLKGISNYAFVNNFIQAFPGSGGGRIAMQGSGKGKVYPVSYATGTKVYLSGNIHTALDPSGTNPGKIVTYRWNAGPGDLDWTSKSNVGNPVQPPSFVLDSKDVPEFVLANAGNRFKGPGGERQLDEVDQRALSDAKNNTRTCYPEYCKTRPMPYPKAPMVSRPADFDKDNDGISDSWETKTGLDPSDSSDGAQIAANGYSHLENYLNWIVGEYQLPSSSDSLRAPANLRVE